MGGLYTLTPRIYATAPHYHGSSVDERRTDYEKKTEQLSGATRRSRRDAVLLVHAPRGHRRLRPKTVGFPPARPARRVIFSTADAVYAPRGLLRLGARTAIIYRARTQ